MPRGLLAFASTTLLLVGAAAACAPTGPSDSTPNPPAVEATSVRRTAVAAAQRIIANNPAATSTPSPTATPAPACPGAIWWREARAHVGESRPIQGTVVASRAAPGGRVLLEIGQLYPDPTGLAVVVPAEAASGLDGKMVCIGGRITAIEGNPTIVVRDPSSIVVVN